VQRGDVAMADGLLSAGVGTDALDGQIDLDEALGVVDHWESDQLFTLIYLHFADTESFCNSEVGSIAFIQD